MQPTECGRLTIGQERRVKQEELTTTACGTAFAAEILANKGINSTHRKDNI